MNYQDAIEELVEKQDAMLAEMEKLRALVEHYELSMGTLNYTMLKDRLMACEMALRTVAYWAFEREDDQPNIHWMTQDQNDGHGYAVSEIRNLLRRHGIKAFSDQGPVVRGGEAVKREVRYAIDELVSGHTEKKSCTPEYDAGVVYACHEIWRYLEPSERKRLDVIVTPINPKEA